jgi:hypothetical protein
MRVLMVIGGDPFELLKRLMPPGSGTVGRTGLLRQARKFFSAGLLKPAAVFKKTSVGLHSAESPVKFRRISE